MDVGGLEPGAVCAAVDLDPDGPRLGGGKRHQLRQYFRVVNEHLELLELVQQGGAAGKLVL